MRLTLTANKRLAQTTLSQYAAQQLAAGNTAWEAPEVLTFSTWQRQLWDAWVVLQCEAGIEPPILLDANQAKHLWQQIIETQAQTLSDLLHPALLATQAANAWKLIHAWQIDLDDTAFTDGTPEHVQFASWSQAFIARCEQDNWLDESRLLSALIQHLPALASLLPQHIQLIGFVQMTALELSFWQRLQQLGVIVDGLTHHAIHLPPIHSARAFASIDDEQNAIAHWVASQLANNPDARLVVALPRMREWRDGLLEKMLSLTAAQSLLPHQLDAPPPVNLSLGDPLAQQPIVAIARLLLGLRFDGIDHADLLNLLRSPFSAGSVEALRLGQWLTEAQTAHWQWKSLFARMKRIDESLTHQQQEQGALSDKEQRLLAAVRMGLHCLTLWKLPADISTRRLPSDWAIWMRSRLTQVGLSPRGLGSLAYQAWTALDDAFDQLAPLDLVSGKVSLEKALSLLDGVLIMPWQARQGKTQVQLLGMMEAAGLACDALWIADMGFEQWPPKATPNPLIPLRLQKQAGVRDADPSKQADYARQLLAAVMEQAGQITVSHARSDGSRVDLLPTGLLTVDWQNALSSPSLTTQHITPLLWQDWQAPPLVTNEAAKGGTGLFKAQSQCPFRAFAQFRLDAKDSKTASEGPDAALRGTLVHNSLEAVWKAIGNSDNLLDLSDRQRLELVHEKVAQTLAVEQEASPDLLGERYLQLEQQRITDLVLAVLMNDTHLALSGLPAFSVESEASLKQDVCGIAVNLRIDRLQTFDTAAPKATWIVDYKTGAVSAKDWQGERPWEPQLPVYALALAQRNDVAGLAFYALKDSDKPQLQGLARDDVPLPSLTRNDTSLSESDWQAQLTQWNTTLQTVADDFRAGVATADPIMTTGKNACTYCHLALLCRKAEWSQVDHDDT